MRPQDRQREKGDATPPSPPGGKGEGRGAAGPVRAVVTIVSGNYIAQARVLCRSLMEHEPEVRRFVLLVDRPVAKAVRNDEPFEVIPVESLRIPDFDDFMAQYTVMEANTAVKPYVLAHLFEHFGVDRLVYLDPDILVMGPLTEVWNGLERGNVVLTPHLRDPFRDLEHPTELEILRSGTYNLGFVALRRGENADRLLEWWCEKTEHDCVVDLANGLFVDQKWMDLVPGYIDDVVLLRDPEYNIAYWNLHERELTEQSGKYFVDGRPLAFFHFSGYSPDRPLVLSRHQTRHDLRSLPVHRRLFDFYGSRLREEDHDEAKSYSYGFAKLSNGIPVSPALRAAVRKLRKEGIRYPSVHDANAFCEFVTTPNAGICGTEISPFVEQLLIRRPDVLAAHPGARYDAQDPGFLVWLENSGHEAESDLLFARFRPSLVRINPFDKVVRIYESRDDLRTTYPNAFQTLEGLDRFGDWLRAYGVFETNVDRREVDAFVDAGRTGFGRVIEYYLASPVLQAHFPLGLLPWGNDFVQWLLRNGLREANLSTAEILWFRQRVREASLGELALLTALRNEWVRLRFPLAATVFGWREFCSWLRAQATARGVHAPSFPDEPPETVPMLLQLEALHATGAHAERYPGALRSRESLRQFAETATAQFGRALTSRQQERLDAELLRYAPREGVNVAGYFHYSAGVGSSARSLARTLDAAGIAHDDITLPVCPSFMMAADPNPVRIPRRFWQLHRADFGVNITVANADAMRVARAFLGPGHEHGRRNIGYWVWETDRLPGKHADEAEGLSAIWTPSEYSAQSIRRTIGGAVPVEVVPHTVQMQRANDHRPLPFHLPEKATLFGFFFDARSSIERKNPADLLRAFRSAFRRDDAVALVLKVSHSDGAPAAMRELQALAEGLPVVWIRDVNLDERQTHTLLDRLDVYASLHRAEGFGLVLAEAMALGKPVVATGFSGNLEFMDDSSSRLVRADEVVTDRAHGPYPRGTRWAAPDVEHAADLFRALATNRHLRQEIGQKARQRIEQTLAPQVVARTLVQRLGLGTAPRISRVPQPSSNDAGAVRDQGGEAVSTKARIEPPVRDRAAKNG